VNTSAWRSRIALTGSVADAPAVRDHQRREQTASMAGFSTGPSNLDAPPEAIEVCSELVRRLHHDLGYTRAVAVTFAGPASAGAIAYEYGQSIVLFDRGEPDAASMDAADPTADDPLESPEHSVLAEACRTMKPAVCHAAGLEAEPVIAALLPEAGDVLVVPMTSRGRCLGYALAERREQSLEFDDTTSRSLVRSVAAAVRVLADPAVQRELEAAIDVKHLVSLDSPGSSDAKADQAIHVAGAGAASLGTDFDASLTEARRWTPRVAVYALLAVLVVAAPVLALGGPPILRGTVGLVALLVAPGAAVTGFFEIDHPGDEVLLAVVVSIAIDVFGAELMLRLGVWQPVGLATVVALTSILLVRHARHAHHVGSRPRQLSTPPVATAHQP
jgi:hypothetical protein